MLEFVFFHPRPQQRFVAFLATRAVTAHARQDDDVHTVAIDEEIDEALLDAIEAFYDEMMTLDRELFELDSLAQEQQTAGVVLILASGEAVYARVDPVLLARVMTVLSPQELGDLVNAIVDAVENPDRRPLCHDPGGRG